MSAKREPFSKTSFFQIGPQWLSPQHTGKAEICSSSSCCQLHCTKQSKHRQRCLPRVLGLSHVKASFACNDNHQLSPKQNPNTKLIAELKLEWAMLPDEWKEWRGRKIWSQTWHWRAGLHQQEKPGHEARGTEEKTAEEDSIEVSQQEEQH